MTKKKHAKLPSMQRVKVSLQQQIHSNGNIFGNKCCRCNEGSLYQPLSDFFDAKPGLGLRSARMPESSAS